MQLFPGAAFSIPTQPCSTWERRGNLHARTQLFRRPSDPLLTRVSNKQGSSVPFKGPHRFLLLVSELLPASAAPLWDHTHTHCSRGCKGHTQQTTQERKRPLRSITDLPCGKVHHKYTS